MMPGVDGWGVLEAIKQGPEGPARTVPVLMLTADDNPQSRIRGGIEGAIRYLNKPFSPVQLRAEVNDALGGEPEPVRRRRSQQAALEQLARSERGDDAVPGPAGPRPHLTRLERTPAPVGEPKALTDARARLADLTVKQRELLEHLAATPTVSDAAAELGVSRSNVYASLRRISRKLGIASVPEVLRLVRDGVLDPGASH
jgi:DNA-binding NarL/FixJ family response regulator